VVIEVDIGSAWGSDRLNGQPDPCAADHGAEDERDNRIEPVRTADDKSAGDHHGEADQTDHGDRESENRADSGQIKLPSKQFLLHNTIHVAPSIENR
jgi:hypothetical protein